MTETSAPLRPAPRPPSRHIEFAANATMLFPLLMLTCLHLEWLLAWCVLGHMPTPSIDDPKGIPLANLMHIVTIVALVGLLPMGVAAILLNAWHVIDRRLGAVRLVVRVLAALALLGGTIAWMRWDPARVGEWWID